MSKNVKIGINLFILLSIFLFQGCVNEDEPSGGNIEINDMLPQFSVQMNDGNIITTQDFLGKIGVIMFFNTNCPDCREELPVIQELWEKYKENDEILIVPISRDESLEEILEYWTNNNLNLPFSPQNNREVYSLFASSIIPRIYISDKMGKIVFMSGDDDMPSYKQLSNFIESILL